MAVYKTGLGQKRTQNLKPDADPLDHTALYKVVHSVQMFMPPIIFLPCILLNAPDSCYLYFYVLPL